MNDELNVSTNSDASAGFELIRNADWTGEEANTFASSGGIIVVPDCVVDALFSFEFEHEKVVGKLREGA